MKRWEYDAAKDLGLAPAERARSLRREAGLLSSFIAFGFRVGARAWLAAMHRLRVHGRDNLPAEAPFVMVANHSSHLDTFALAAALPAQMAGRAFPIAAGDTFFETPLPAVFAAYFLNALPLWRRRCGPHELEELRARLVGDPAVYILFPEGGRSRTGEMTRFKPGLGRIVAGTKAAVVPCHLEGALRAMPPGARIPRPAGLRLRIGEPLYFAGVANDRAGWNAIAAETERAVRALAGESQALS